MNERALNRIDFEVHNLEEHLGKGKLKKKLKNIGDKIKDAAKNLQPIDAAYLPLVPFKPVIKKRLDKKGIKYKSTKLKDLAEAFHRAEIKGSNLENYIDEEKSKDITIPSTPFGAAAEIVQAIINYIKKKKEDKNLGKTGPDDDEFLLDIDDATEKSAQLTPEDLAAQVTTQETAQPTPGGIFEKKNDNTMLYVVIAAVAIYYFTNK